MHGGNALTGFYEDIDSEFIYLFTPNGEETNYYSTAHYKIALNHIDKIEFIGPRESKGFEFIGLEH